MDISEIMIGIVLYNPDLKRLSVNINSCLNQVNNILLVDNSSNNIEKIQQKFLNNKKINILRNSQNMGIAHALNQILNFAYKNGFKYCLTLDQDSIMAKDYIKNILQHQSLPNHCAIIAPCIKDTNLSQVNGDNERNSIEMIANAKDVISSGSLIDIDAAIRVGGFNDNLFIDYVDVDFNQRILNAGYSIVRINDSVLYHELGYSQYHKLLGIRVLVDNHNAIRRYYITRNRLYYAKKYFGNSEYYKERIKVWLSKIKILLFEENKRDKIQSINRGIRDERKLC